MSAIAPNSALVGKVCSVCGRYDRKISRFAICLLICCIAFQNALADTITYQQLRQDLGGRALTTAPIPAAARTNQTTQNSQGQNQPQAPKAQESPNRPEFVRLADGRIVRYGPGVVCDENCVDPVAPYAFRGEGTSMWWFVPPVAAGVILCIVLCGGDDNTAQPTPTIIIPTPTPSVPPQPTPTTSPEPTPQPSVSPSVGPTPPPNEIPEPGTIVLVGLGLGAMLARRRRAARKEQE